VPRDLNFRTPRRRFESRPLYRDQGNRPNVNAPQTGQGPLDRGQEVPYDVNGAPSAPQVGAFVMDINGLVDADPSEPLYEFVVPAGGLIFTATSDHITAGVAATSASALRFFKNGAANGTIDFSAGGTVGTNNISNSTYAEGDLFGFYPPTSIDPTLDRVRITLGTD